jgi:PAS domain S-box-containing protein
MPARRAILENVYENADLAIFVVDVLRSGGFRFVDINPRHEEITGLSADWIRGRRLRDLRPRLPGETLREVRRHYDRCVREERSIEYEEKLIIDDRPSWWLTRLNPLIDDSGQVHRLVGTSMPITERRRLEERLRAALKEMEAARSVAETANKAKSAFLAAVSHEIRTPLSSILGFVELLQETALAGNQRTYADTIARSGQQLRVLLDNVLDLSKAEAGQMELQARPFDLHAVISDAVRQMAPDAAKQETELMVSIGSSLPQSVVGDPDRLRQILLNLLSNAIKFTADGRVDVVARVDPGAEKRTGERDAADRAFTLQLEVQDTGVGIPESEQEAIFEAFQQGSRRPERWSRRTRASGVGLGLAITQEIVELMGGSLHLDSTVGEGSTFGVRVPLHRSGGHRLRATERDSAPETEGSRFASVQVLVVEDEPSHRYLTEQYLRRLGVEPDTAENGTEALRLLEGNAYDVVFMDVGLPGLTGVDLTRRIRARTDLPHQPQIIAATAQAVQGDRERFLSAGMDGYLSKPFDLVDLAEALRRAIPK